MLFCSGWSPCSQLPWSCQIVSKRKFLVECCLPGLDFYTGNARTVCTCSESWDSLDPTHIFFRVPSQTACVANLTGCSGAHKYQGYSVHTGGCLVLDHLHIGLHLLASEAGSEDTHPDFWLSLRLVPSAFPAASEAGNTGPDSLPRLLDRRSLESKARSAACGKTRVKGFSCACQASKSLAWNMAGLRRRRLSPASQTTSVDPNTPVDARLAYASIIQAAKRTKGAGLAYTMVLEKAPVLAKRRCTRVFPAALALSSTGPCKISAVG